ATMLLFALFLKMSNGATYAVVPFINPRAVGIVSGIVGAGGNVGAVLAGLLFSADAHSYRINFMVIGGAVIAISLLSFLLAFSKRIDADTSYPTTYDPSPALPTLADPR